MCCGRVDDDADGDNNDSAVAVVNEDENDNLMTSLPGSRIRHA